MPALYLDIETLPGPNRPDPSTIPAPKNYKDPAKIEAYQHEKVEDAYRAQALNSMQGRILAIGYAFEDEEPQVLIQGRDGIQSEAHLLEAFQGWLMSKEKYLGYMHWVGHNLRTFDLSWIWRKALQWRVSPLANLIPRKRFDERIQDTMEMWAADFKDRVSLAELAEFLGVGGKTPGLDGSKVFDYFQAGQLEDIAEYCRQDVNLVRDVYLTINGENIERKEAV